MLKCKLISLLCLILIRNTTWSIEVTKWISLKNLPQPRHAHASVVVNKFIYILGGAGGSKTLNSVYFAKIKQGGTLGDWKSTTEMPKPAAYLKAVSCNNKIYILGGHTGEKKNALIKTVYYAKVNGDGTIKTWNRTTSLPVPTLDGAALVYNNKLYYIGGWYRRSVYFARIKKDGSIGEWNETSHLPSPRMSFDAIAINGYIYALGGNSIINTPKKTVFKTTVNEDGTLNRWKRCKPLPFENSQYAACLVNNFILMLGGNNFKSQTFSCKVFPDGRVGKWQSLKRLPIGEQLFDAVYTNGKIYVTGGCVSTKTGYKVVSSVYMAEIPGQSDSACTKKRK